MFKKVKRIICFLFIICLSVTAFVACGGGYKWGPVANEPGLSTTAGLDGENGGMAVKYGDYLYFINGMDDYKDNLRGNEFGKVIKGSICRMPISDLEKSGEDARNANVKIIVPKVIVANYADGGFYIYNGWIFYTTPNSERGSSGGVQSSWVDFMKVKVDGTGTTRLLKINPADNDGIIPFKFIETANNQVYLIYYSKNVLYKLNATKNGSAVKISEKVTSYVFGDKEVYYSRQEVKTDSQDVEENETFTTAWSADPSGEPKNISAVLAGMTDTEYGNAASEEKYSYTLTSFQKGILFYTRARSFGGVTSDKGIWGYKADEATSKIKPFTNNAAGTNFFCVSWTGGLVVYTGTRFDRYPGSASATAYTETPYNMFFPDNTGITLYFLNGNILYYGVSATGGAQVWCFDITESEASKQPMLSSKAKQITLSSVHNEWLKPKLIGNKIFFINGAGYTDGEGEIVDAHIENGFEYYTYFVNITNLPDPDVDDDDLADEIAKEVWIGKHDSKDEKED